MGSSRRCQRRGNGRSSEHQRASGCSRCGQSRTDSRLSGASPSCRWDCPTAGRSQRSSPAAPPPRRTACRLALKGSYPGLPRPPRSQAPRKRACPPGASRPFRGRSPAGAATGGQTGTVGTAGSESPPPRVLSGKDPGSSASPGTLPASRSSRRRCEAP